MLKSNFKFSNHSKVFSTIRDIIEFSIKTAKKDSLRKSRNYVEKNLKNLIRFGTLILKIFGWRPRIPAPLMGIPRSHDIGTSYPPKSNYGQTTKLELPVPCVLYKYERNITVFCILLERYLFIRLLISYFFLYTRMKFVKGNLKSLRVATAYYQDHQTFHLCLKAISP